MLPFSLKWIRWSSLPWLCTSQDSLRFILPYQRLRTSTVLPITKSEIDYRPSFCQLVGTFETFGRPREKSSTIERSKSDLANIHRLANSTHIPHCEKPEKISRNFVSRTFHRTFITSNPSSRPSFSFEALFTGFIAFVCRLLHQPTSSTLSGLAATHPSP